MPPVAAAVGAIAGGIASVGGAAVGLAGSALGGLAAAGGSALGGLAAAGGSALGGLLEAGKVIAPQIATIGAEGQKIYGIFDKPDQPSGQQPTKQPTQDKSIPTNILNTLPNIIRQPQQQIITTPAPTPKQAPENTLVKYAPWIAAAVLGYFVLGK